MQSKGNHKQKDNPQNGRKYLQMMQSKKGLVSKIYKQLMGLNFQNIQAAHTTQYQKNKQPNQKVGKTPKQTFFQRRHADG